MILAALVLASLPVRTVQVPQPTGPSSPVRIRLEVPVGQTTRVVFPERAIRVFISVDAEVALGAEPEATRPLGIFRLNPPAPVRGETVDFTGPKGQLTLVVQAVTRGEASEVRLVFQEPAAAPPAVATLPTSRPPAIDPPPAVSAPTKKELESAVISMPSPGPKSTEHVDPIPSTAVVTVPPPAAPSKATLAPIPVDVQPVRVGRREGRPGQRPMTLNDYLRSREFVWLRFTVAGGAKARVTNVTREGGKVATFSAESAGKDLFVVVQLPTNEVKKRTRVTVTLDESASYTFPLSAPWFSTFFKGLVGLN